MRLTGKIALITGGSSGIGLATARRFAQEGAEVIITGRRESSLESARAELGERVSAWRSDVMNAADRSCLFAEIEQRFGHIDVIFANAGAVKTGTISDMTEATFNDILHANITSVFLTVQGALPLLREGSSIVVNGSVAASAGFFPGAGAYAASKAGVHGMVQAMAAELSQSGIRINTVVPGIVKTPLWGDHKLPESVAQERADRMKARVPLNRWATPDEIAGVVLFLASEDARYLQGTEIFVDGGLRGATFGAPVYRT
ncbi:SDR family oxidoreductase [Pandoraea sputorum]|uniref:SDR family NAD(P)-dependent oxidoreductase n=1 Tax=Pandoraea sputorum TaxID=93222 RepID=UPI001E33B572|nr:SDR family oxidoreductase [Pandoraea sputorum]MCE4062153.1 SDR family oxidoreductase [Pandoraea sputorum]